MAAWAASLEGMINLPIGDTSRSAAVAFYQRDAGYIDNVFGARGPTTSIRVDASMRPPTVTVDNSRASWRSNFNDHRRPMAAAPR